VLATYAALRQEIRGPVVPPRLCLTSGAPCGPAARAAVRDLFGVPLLNGYGATETGGKIAVEVPGETGLVPLPGNEIRIDDGEIFVRGPGLMLGYHGQTGSPFEDGWYRTGDAGRLDGGKLVLDGWIDDVIVCGGQNRGRRSPNSGTSCGSRSRQCSATRTRGPSPTTARSPSWGSIP
jgi:acyl-coenzyme A synthetase/AMP-(fatty) acid ligase